jgi:hypothetical protein
MLHLLKRHPWAVRAHFEWVLALVFAIPEKTARELMVPGLEPDLYEDQGFVAAALVQARGLRPTWVPSCLEQDCYVRCDKRTRINKSLSACWVSSEGISLNELIA